jgi:glycine cleavage system transcriptional repressor
MSASPASHVRTLITAVGIDRPGIVGDLSRWIYDRGGNIEDSRMALLGGEFAVLMLIAGDEGLAQRLEAAREAFQLDTGLTLLLHPAAAEPRREPTPALRYNLTATTLDHPGIVYTISRLLSARRINIIRADTRTTPAPFTGTPVFRLDMEMDIPATLSIPHIRQELESLGEAENIDIRLYATES